MSAAAATKFGFKEDGSGTANLADNGATVGMQAQEIKDSYVYVTSNTYTVPDGATAQEIYEVGVRHLDAGLPAQAQRLIFKAIAGGYDSAEVRLHWLLAMLSKRSYRDLKPQEREMLARAAEVVESYADDEWRRALETIFDLLDCLRTRTDAGSALQELTTLPANVRAGIERHLDLVITGGMKDRLWQRSWQRAVDERLAHNRKDRVWAYFEPKPADARARVAEARNIGAWGWLTAVGWAALFGIAEYRLARLALGASRPLLTAYAFTGLLAAAVAAWTGTDWRFRHGRWRALGGGRPRRRKWERIYGETPAPGVVMEPKLMANLLAPSGPVRGRRPAVRPPDVTDRGFASGVDRTFTYYFGRYAPAGIEAKDWLTESAFVRRRLRNEVVEIYREQRTSAGQVAWLIRFMARQVRDLYEAGGDWKYMERFRVEWRTRAMCIAALTWALGSLAAVSAAAIGTQPVAGVAMTLLSAVAGAVGSLRCVRIGCEFKRHRDDQRVHDEARRERAAERDRWVAKLEATRPSESEMEYWLYCDKTVVLGKALRHYKLAWQDVIAHAFLSTPAEGTTRSRVTHGPWRYSKYEIRLFLVTVDGVREVCDDVDFERGDFGRQLRLNYRFDAVSSIGVDVVSRASNFLELSLNNGPARQITITEPVKSGFSAPEETDDELSTLNLEAAGFVNALHILEGIAAEGKAWMDRDPVLSGDEEWRWEQSASA